MEGSQSLLANRTVRIATYNILNTKDRYAEREPFIKQVIYGEINADIVGL